MKLCSHPGIVEPDLWDLVDQNGRPEPFQAANGYLQQNISRRELELKNLHLVASHPQNRYPGVVTFTSNLSRSWAGTHFLPLGLPIPVYSLLRSRDATSPALIPLNECILAIAWEFHDRPTACKILGDGNIAGVVEFLQHSAIYQAKFEKVGGDRSVECDLDNYLISHATSYPLNSWG